MEEARGLLARQHRTNLRNILLTHGQPVAIDREQVVEKCIGLRVGHRLEVSCVGRDELDHAVAELLNLSAILFVGWPEGLGLSFGERQIGRYDSLPIRFEIGLQLLDGGPLVNLLRACRVGHGQDGQTEDACEQCCFSHGC